MARSRSATADAIRIEDEVWDEAFEARVPSRARRVTLTLAPETVALVRPGSESALERAPRPVVLPVRADVPAPSAAPGLPETEDAPPGGIPGRRTIRIQGRGAERHLPWPEGASRRRPSRSLPERARLAPDRLAMWAVFLGLLLVLVAAVSAHG